MPSITEIQQVVDRAAGAAMSSHGGAIIVTAVDHATVSLRSEGACEGCRQINGTILGLIKPAVRSAHPGIVEIVHDAGAEREPAPDFEPVQARKRLRIINRNRSCH